MGSLVTFFAFCRVFFGASFSFSLDSEGAVFFVAGRFFLDASSFLVGTSKNRERDGGRNSSDGDEVDGVVVAAGSVLDSLTVLLASLVGIHGEVLGDEDKIITSAELVIVASSEFCCRVVVVVALQARSPHSQSTSKDLTTSDENLTPGSLRCGR